MELKILSFIPLLLWMLAYPESFKKVSFPGSAFVIYYLGGCLMWFVIGVLV